MNLKNKKMQKFISSLLVVAILLPSIIVFSIPSQTNAQNADPVVGPLTIIGNVFRGTATAAQLTQLSTTLKSWAETLFKQILMSIARKALAEMTKSTVNWINSGFHGAPLFLENPSSFFNDITKSQVKNLINLVGY